MQKQPFEIDQVMQRLRQAVRPYPQAAMFELRDRGYGSLFEQLMACMISIRTRDEVSLVTAIQLFEHARTPAEMMQLSVAQIATLIQDCTFYANKAAQMRTIAQQIMQQYDGELPSNFAVLTGFTGIGPKCANLALSIACGQPRISVDVHVHRVTNRWGYVQTRSPEKTLVALEEKLPRQYWIEINQRLVPFGKHICTNERPRCDQCPLLDQCQQVRVHPAP